MCVVCGDPHALRERTAARTAAAAIESWVATNYRGSAGLSRAGHQPAAVGTFSDKMEVPAGAPVTFHRRKRCFPRGGRVRPPLGRHRSRSPTAGRCTVDGRVTNHNDGTTTAPRVLNVRARTPNIVATPCADARDATPNRGHG